MKVKWTQTAIGHLADVYDYISHDSARYATQTVDRITARSKQIGQFPETGQIVAEYADSAIREIIVGPYRLIYRTQPDSVEVLAVIHGARLLPPELPRDNDP